MPHVTFIHGMANKDPEDELLSIWVNALAASDGLRLSTKGVTSSMVYWADVLYEKPSGQEDGHESVGTEGQVLDPRFDGGVEWRDSRSTS